MITLNCMQPNFGSLSFGVLASLKQDPNLFMKKIKHNQHYIYSSFVIERHSKNNLNCEIRFVFSCLELLLKTLYFVLAACFTGSEPQALHTHTHTHTYTQTLCFCPSHSLSELSIFVLFLVCFLTSKGAPDMHITPTSAALQEFQAPK